MSDVPSTPEWWQASDGKWYPPELHPSRQPAAPPPPAPAAPPSTAPPGPFASPAGPPTFDAPPPQGPPDAWVPVGSGPPQGPAGSKAWWRQPWALLGGAALSLLLIGGGAWALLADDDGDDEARVTTEESTDVAESETAASETEDEPATADDPTGEDPPPLESATATDVGKPTSTPTESTETAAAPATGEGECSFVEVDDFGDIQVRFDLVGPGPDVADLQITYALLDDGVRFEEGSTFLSQVAPGERVLLEQDTFTDAPADLSAFTCEVLEIEAFPSFEPLISPASSDSCAYEGVDSFGDMQVELEITAPVETTGDVSVYYALRAGDVRIYGGQTFLELLSPGDEVRRSEDTFTEPPDGVDTDEITCVVLGFSAF